MELITKRPKGLAPGSVEWLREIEGPRLVKRLVDEVHANPAGEMTPTQARCASMLMDRIAPTVSAVQHTVETRYAQLTEDQIKERLLQLTGAIAETVPFVDKPAFCAQCGKAGGSCDCYMDVSKQDSTQQSKQGTKPQEQKYS